jgi:DNA polymerase elongation subunit (family B)
MKENIVRRYRLSDETALSLGLELNKSKRYRVDEFQEKRLILGRRLPKVMIYDIETSRATFKGWWTGKQFVGSHQIVEEPKIISIAWKWLGTDEVKWLTWDKNHSDKQMLKEFLREYNNADIIIGQNNNKFDNRWINARALKYNLDVNTLVRSLDLMKESKRVFRLPGYSMKFITDYTDIPTKMEHEGIKMWEMIEDGTLEQQDEYLAKMVDYNVQDIIATEAMYFRLRKYIRPIAHMAKLMGGDKYDCPHCGSESVEHKRTTYTAAGTLQHIMGCSKCGGEYKISNRTYLNWVEDSRAFS